MRGVIQVGDAVGPFTIVAKLGRGGMSTVYNAYEAGLDREVALKVLPLDLLEEPGFADRFEREARLIAKLEHPHIVPLYSYGIDDGIPWMALRLVRGGNLSDRLGRNAVGREAGLAYFTMIADALDHAHHLGVVHRDLKPQNVLLGEHGELYLADFGISRLLQGRTTITSTGAVLGTPQYMSPEQAQDSQVGPATDIYALGVMVYQWLTGLLPFDADTPFAVMFKHVNSPLEVEPLRQYPERVQQVLVRALSKQPEQRWPSAGGFMEELAVAMGAEDLPGQVLATGRLPASMAAAISSRKLNRLPPAPTEILRDLPTPTGGLSTPRPRTPTPPAQPPVEPAAPTIVRPGSAGGPGAATGGRGSAPPVAPTPGPTAGGAAAPPPASPPPPPAAAGPAAPGELQFRPRGAPPKPAGPNPKVFAIAGGVLLLAGALAWLLLRDGDEAPVEAAPVAAPVEAPAEPQAPAEPPPLPAGDGRLLLESDLDCELSINGLKRGELKANTPLRLEIAPGRYPVACVSPAHPDVVASQVALVTREDPTVALFELKYEIDQRERQRQEQERRRLEQEKADALARQQQEDREAAEARRLVEEARRREDERKAEEERTLQEARQAAERRRREEELKLEEARRAAAARRTGQAPAATSPAAPAAASPGVAARPDEAQARQAQARRQAEARRKAEEEAAAKAAAEQLAAQQRAEAEAAAAAAAAAKARRTTPIPVSTPQPDYPKDALRSGTTGAVEVQITIGRDGRVTDVRVLQSRPRGVFDREVISTVRGWRFEPLDEEVKLVRSFVFK